MPPRADREAKTPYPESPAHRGPGPRLRSLTSGPRNASIPRTRRERPRRADGAPGRADRGGVRRRPFECPAPAPLPPTLGNSRRAAPGENFRGARFFDLGIATHEAYHLTEDVREVLVGICRRLVFRASFPGGATRRIDCPKGPRRPESPGLNQCDKWHLRRTGLSRRSKGEATHLRRTLSHWT